MNRNMKLLEAEQVNQKAGFVNSRIVLDNKGKQQVGFNKGNICGQTGYFS